MRASTGWHSPLTPSWCWLLTTSRRASVRPAHCILLWRRLNGCKLRRCSRAGSLGWHPTQEARLQTEHARALACPAGRARVGCSHGPPAPLADGSYWQGHGRGLQVRQLAAAAGRGAPEALAAGAGSSHACAAASPQLQHQHGSSMERTLPAESADPCLVALCSPADPHLAVSCGSERAIKASQALPAATCLCRLSAVRRHSGGIQWLPAQACAWKLCDPPPPSFPPARCADPRRPAPARPRRCGA